LRNKCRTFALIVSSMMPCTDRASAWRLGSSCMQLHTQCPGDLEDSREVRRPFPRQRLVQAFTREPGLARNLGHALRTGDISQRLCDKRGIALTLLDAGVQI